MTTEPEEHPEPSREEILSRLDEILDDGEDIEIPELEEAPAEDPWAPLDAEPDREVPVEPVREEPQPPAWGPVGDDPEAELVLPELDEPAPDDPWTPTDPAAPEAPIGAPQAPSDPSFSLPRARPQPALQPARRTLPWRSTVDLACPPLPALLCVADPTARGSRLLVASWRWADEEAGDSLLFRISDDGPELTVAPASPHEATVDAALKLGALDLRARLYLESSRDRRGVVLGRDVLAGRFVVDPALDHWSEDDE